MSSTTTSVTAPKLNNGVLFGYTLHQLSFTTISVLLGLWAFQKVNAISGPMFEPIIAACQLPLSEFESTDYHPYEPKVGLVAFNILVCLITQFMHDLVENSPGGLLMWGLIIVVSLPIGVMGMVEAGREDVRGPVRYPVATGLLYQLFGISVMFPLVWLPGYILGRGTGGVSPTRAWASIPLTLPGLVLTTLVFTLDPSTYAFTVAAGMLGGPVLVLSPLLLWAIQTPPAKDARALSEGSKVVTKAYHIAGIVAALAWYALLYVVHTSYHWNLPALWTHVWTDANPCVAFMTVDSIVLWVALLIYIGYRCPRGLVESLVWCPLVGPGASCAMIMGRLEREGGAKTIRSKEE